MYTVSWQNLLMMNSTIPPIEEGDNNGRDRRPSGEPINFWELGQRLMSGKGA